MTANRPFDRDLRQPVQAVGPDVAKAGWTKAPLMAVPAGPKPKSTPVLLPGPHISRDYLPRLFGPSRALATKASDSRKVWAGAAVLVSSLLHGGLVLAVVAFAPPVQPLLPPDLETAEVALISQAQFMALTAPKPAVFLTPAALAAPARALVPPPALAASKAPPALEPPPEIAQAAPDMAPQQSAPPEALVKPEPLVKPKAKAAEAQQAPPKAAKAKAKASAGTLAPKAASAAASTPAPSKPASAAQTASPGQAKTLKADWGAKVRARVNRHVQRPAGAGAGTVKIQLKIAPSGKLLAAGVVKSSGQAALDAAALRAATSAAPFARAPKGLADASYSFTLPIRFDG